MRYGSHKKLTPEAQITYGIRSLLNQFGIFHWKHWGGPMGTKGVSDIIGCYKGRMLAIEIKSEKGRVTADQQYFLDQVNKAGGLGFVAKSIDDVIRELNLNKSSMGEYLTSRGC
jgi:hypothetical protein